MPVAQLVFAALRAPACGGKSVLGNVLRRRFALAGRILAPVRMGFAGVRFAAKGARDAGHGVYHVCGGSPALWKRTTGFRQRCYRMWRPWRGWKAVGAPAARWSISWRRGWTRGGKLPIARGKGKCMALPLRNMGNGSICWSAGKPRCPRADGWRPICRRSKEWGACSCSEFALARHIRICA